VVDARPKRRCKHLTVGERGVWYVPLKAFGAECEVAVWTGVLQAR
jgi:hypothetical protein